MTTLNALSPTDPDLLHSRLFSALLKTIDYAAEHDGIGLTKSKAFNRKFVTWAAEHYAWPGYTTDELMRMNKVLDEQDVPPVFVVHDLMALMKLGRHVKDCFRLSRLARGLRADPGALFDLTAQTYLFGYNHARIARSNFEAPGNWDVFLNVINVEAERGVTEADLVRILYGMTERPGAYDREYHDHAGWLFINVLRPLHWIGFLDETRSSPDFLAERTYTKTALWRKCLRLQTDGIAERAVIH